MQKIVYTPGSISNLHNMALVLVGKFDPEKTPVALEISKKVLTLPLYADLDLADVGRVCDIILNCGK